MNKYNAIDYKAYNSITTNIFEVSYLLLVCVISFINWLNLHNVCSDSNKWQLWDNTRFFFLLKMDYFQLRGESVGQLHNLRFPLLSARTIWLIARRSAVCRGEHDNVDYYSML